jgi:hypothetical protein
MPVIGEKGYVYMDYVADTERKKQLGRTRSRYEDILKYILLKCYRVLYIGFV